MGAHPLDACLFFWRKQWFQQQSTDLRKIQDNWNGQPIDIENKGEPTGWQKFYSRKRIWTNT